jgi:acyl carrier protein
MPDAAERPIVTAELVGLKVRQAVANSLEIEVENVHLDHSLVQDLGAQSLDMLDIAFALEREFRIQFPQTDLLQRASSHFGEDALVNEDGFVTDFGLQLLRGGMPEIDPVRLEPPTLAADVIKLITVQTFVRLVLRLIEVKDQFPRKCPLCGSQTIESDVLPEFVCPNCGDTRPLPTGDEVLLGDLLELANRAPSV